VSRHFDAIIIGTGQAGPSLAARFAAAGMAVAIIERHKFGGTCVNTGCIPTKTLVGSAYTAHVARRGAEYGFVVNGDVRVDMKRVKARKDEVAGRSNRGVEEWLRALRHCTVIQGHSRFHSSRTVARRTRVGAFHIVAPDTRILADACLGVAIPGEKRQRQNERPAPRHLAGSISRPASADWSCAQDRLVAQLPQREP
jgi:pyruvate/2-oxoglutarate dehydrogenase complex dihydrolipoamide dehydrogenase (E3) component